MRTLRQLLRKKKDRELKENIRMMNSHRSDIEKSNLFKKGKYSLMQLLSAIKLLIIVWNHKYKNEILFLNAQKR